MESQRRAVIFVNGILTDPAGVRAMLREDDYLVAVNGGFRHMQAIGVQPDLVIGDLDSLDPQELANIKERCSKTERFPREKDETDLELALEKIAAEGFSVIRVVAALGGRLDQTLANLYLLELPALEGIDVRLDDGHEEIFIIRNRTEIEGWPGDTVSLLAMEKCSKGVLTEGLRYPLKEETLCQNRSRGISNEMLSEKAAVQVRSGRLLCIHTRRGKTAQA